MSQRLRALNSKLKALRHFKVDPILKIDETIYKQTESMCRALNSKLKALRHFKVDPILKIDETVKKQAESM